MLPRLRNVVSELHAEKMVHIWAERLFDAQGHLRRQRGFAVQKIGQRGTAYFQILRRLRYVEAEGIDDLGLYEVTRMGRASIPESYQAARSYPQVCAARRPSRAALP
jgi:hypothetical protein